MDTYRIVAIEELIRQIEEKREEKRIAELENSDSGLADLLRQNRIERLALELSGLREELRILRGELQPSAWERDEPTDIIDFSRH